MPKGVKYGGGSRKGKKNIVTKQAGEMINACIDGQLIHFETTMNQIRKESPTDWAKILVSMFKFVMPVKSDLSGELQFSTIRVVRDDE